MRRRSPKNRNGSSSLLDRVNSPADLKKLSVEQLPKLADEVRRLIVKVVSETGGHLASSLGAVDLIVALHYVLNSPKDKIIWDVGHQAYGHKILTGRKNNFHTLRQLGGVSGFPHCQESEHDIFTVGHSSTSISSALGLAAARDLKGGKEKVVAVIGDASLSSGMAFEALNHTGHLKKDLIVILNDNEMFISPPIGALSKYLNRVITMPIYNRVRKDVESLLKKVPKLGTPAVRAAHKLEEGLKNLLVPGILFEEMGFRYFGPISAHDIELLITTINNIKDLGEPILLHLTSKKGKGYGPAEKFPSHFHSAPPFVVSTGVAKPSLSGKSFSKAFGEKMVDLAAKDERIVLITAAMPEGTGLGKFAKKFPNRFFDVGIAEQHAVTFAAGLAKGGLKPVVAIYSTFLQRAYDQIVHDVSLQGLPIVFCLDRAGLSGEDGPTHHGLFDIAYLRQIPRMTIMAPRDTEELSMMCEFALTHDGPIAIRYPRGERYPTEEIIPHDAICFGKSQVLRKGKEVAILAAGYMANTALDAANILSKSKINPTVINARFLKPLDEEFLERLVEDHDLIVTVEEGISEGGFGSAVLEFFERENITKARVLRMALPDQFIEHGRRDLLFKKYHLSTEGIVDMIKANTKEALKAWRR